MENTMYLILAGGRGKRLRPLTDQRPKPLVRFGSSGTIIDFTLYNCLASRGGDVLVLTQYHSEMIESYLRMYWKPAFSAAGRKIETLPSNRSQKGRYFGTADAVHQVLSGRKGLPERIVVLSADHVYRMDYREMVDFHRSHGRAATVGAVRCRPERASDFGIMDMDSGQRITGFHEKPKTVKRGLDREGRPLASMGIYVFTTDQLMEYLARNQEDTSSHDFGKDILPAMVGQGEAMAFDFVDEKGRPGYWRDVGDPRSYWEAHMEMLLFHARDMHSDLLPGMGRLPFASGEMVRNYINADKKIRRSLISRTARVGAADIEQSVIGPGVVVEDGAMVRQSIVLDGAMVRGRTSVFKAVMESYSVTGERKSAGNESAPDIFMGVIGMMHRAAG